MHFIKLFILRFFRIFYFKVLTKILRYCIILIMLKKKLNTKNNKFCSSAQLSSAQLSSAQHHFKLFKILCLLINYKNYYIYFEFIFDKIVYSIKLLYNENNSFNKLLFKNILKMKGDIYAKFLL